MTVLNMGSIGAKRLNSKDETSVVFFVTYANKRNICKASHARKYARCFELRLRVFNR